jgi:CRISPR/Cas system-associated protein Cas5 (RAMP superfamily)
MEDFMDLYSAAAHLGISLRTFERHVEQINIKEPENPIIKIKRVGDKKFYYSASDVNRIRTHIDFRFGAVKRPGDNSPQLAAAA